jgi:intracellular multiplication protein IcmO
MAGTMSTKVIKKQEKKIDRKSDMYRFARDLSIAGTTFTFIINPIFAIPLVLFSKKLHNLYKQHADDNKNLFGKELKPIGTGHGDYITGKGSTGIFFGTDEFGLPIHLSDKEMTTHGIIFGATGAGKTTTIFNIMRQHMARGGGFIFIDGKSENPTWANVYDMCMEVNREDEIFLLSFRAAEESKSNSWNFLLTGSSTQVGEMLSELALPSDAGANQIFVDRGKQLLFSMLSVATYFRDIKKQIITFQDLINMLKPDCLLAILRPTMEDSEEGENTRPYARYWIPDDYIEAGMSTTAKQMIRNFAENIGVSPDGEVPEQQMKLFKDQHSFAAMQFGPTFNDLANTYGKIFNTAVSDIDISDIIANNRILYVLLPSLEKSAASLQGLGKMVLSAVKQACASTLGNKTEGYRNAQMAKEARKKRARPPFLVIADEYGSYAIKGFSDVLAQARSLGVGVIISIQEKASLEKAGKEESIRILGNTVWKMFLKIEDPETIDFGMKRGGKMDIATQNSQSFDKNAPIDDIMKTDENYSISNVSILTEQDFTEPSNGAGVFIIAEEVRKFLGPWYEPDRASAVWLNRLYPTIRMKISDDNSNKKSKLMENDLFDE